MRPTCVTSLLYLLPYYMSRALPGLQLYHKCLGVLLVTSHIYHGYHDWRAADTLVTNVCIVLQTVLLVQCRHPTWLSRASGLAVTTATVLAHAVRQRRADVSWWRVSAMHVALATGAYLYMHEGSGCVMRGRDA